MNYLPISTKNLNYKLNKMKKIILVGLCALSSLSCKQEQPQKDYVTFSGKILHQNSDSLRLFSEKYTKVIKVNRDGSFSDTLKITNGRHMLADGKEIIPIYLKNGYDLRLTLDAKKFVETMRYQGIGAETNDYLVKKALIEIKSLTGSELYELENKAFDSKIEDTFGKINNLLATAKDIDSTFIVDERVIIKRVKDYITNSYEEKQYIATVLAKGNVSPEFIDYENYYGGTISLNDLKGKYVYVDIWATWCKPCIGEIPSLKKLEKEYSDKNIEFVSISIDNQKDYEKWREMVENDELGGIQLYAKEDQTFMEAYKVSGIPRFILIDPHGYIVNANAPRPSDLDIKILLDNLPI
ncbi:TlpA family protein disulfide reductase [uncultured Croceitalea sp.]|uniref:TlpA family protein disulfide reductase n=1 Tax=uncultured Croceitalea sp. TaxID=1798908 RepID=UPI00374E7E2A